MWINIFTWYPRVEIREPYYRFHSTICRMTK